MTSQLALDLAVLPPPTLDNFAGAANAEAVHALRRWATGAGPEHVLYLWGGHGAGKTHLLRAAIDEAAAGGARALLVPSGRALCEVAQAPFDFLAIDDVATADAAGQAMLFSLLRKAADGEIRVLVAGDNAPAGLRLRPDVRTRLGAALVLHLRVLGDEEKIDVLRQHARERGFELPPEGALYLLRHNRRDLVGLLALLDAIDRYSLQAKRPVSLALLREVVRQDLFTGEVAGVVEAGHPLGPVDDHEGDRGAGAEGFRP